MEKLIEIEGIGNHYAAVLEEKAGLVKVKDFLETGKDPDGRKALVEKTGIDHDRILRWVNLADLFRIHGVAEEYSDLLEAAGVDTVVELARRVPANLHQKIEEVHNSELKTWKGRVRRVPSLKEVEKWVAEAKTLDRVVTY